MDYKSARWKALRESVLRRDGYTCRECRRYGVQRQANTAHHVWPAKDFPEWAWEPGCLVALCHKCHNAMHIRDSEDLTEKGRAWQRRLSPPGR